ncbi:MAG TPA: hypothetical protein VKQ36_03490 [Ktedonobacterales bacterium]|nr:hypothetical protein [Ktedonobacterales bacterium]
MESTEQTLDDINATPATKTISQPLESSLTSTPTFRSTFPPQQQANTSKARRHWGWSALTHALGLVVGLALGATLTLAWLVWYAPSAQPALPNTATAGPGSIAITVDDAFLTNVTQAAISSASLPVPITNVHAHILAGDSIVITGQTPALPFLGPGHFSATAQPLVSNGKLSIHLLKGTLGGITAPTQVLRAIEIAINQQLDGTTFAPTIGNVQYVVVSVTTTTGHMTMTLEPQQDSQSH